MGSAVSRLLNMPVMALALCIAASAFLLPLNSASAAEPPPAEKVDKLIELLSDPAVKSWLADKGKMAPAVPPPIARTSAMTLTEPVTRIREHLQSLLAALRLLPAEFERARNIFAIEYQDNGISGLAPLLLVFIAAGFGFDWIARRLMTPYRNWMLKLPWNTPAGRAKSFLARLLYAAVLILAFAIGSAGVFVIFQWPPLLKELLLTYLSVVIIVRVALMASRAALLPPHLKAPHGGELRLLPLSDESAAHWYRWIGIVVAWIALSAATLGLLPTFGFSGPVLELIGIPASFILLTLLLLTIWLRPRSGGTMRFMRGSHNAVSWIFTVGLAGLWLLRATGNWFVLWPVLAAVSLALGIAITHRAVNYLLRPPEGETGATPTPPFYVALLDRCVRLVLILGTAYWLTQAMGITFDGMDQMTSPMTMFLKSAFKILFIVVAADFVWTLLKAAISHRLNRDSLRSGESLHQRQDRLGTLLPIVQNFLFFGLLVMLVLTVLSIMGIEIAPLIAGAGVVGVAVGFGSQTLVKDVISGMFYLFDDAFRIGEYIESGNFKGTVEAFSLRSVKLRHHRGYLFTVPFGELGAVQNMSRDWVIEKFNITVGYDTDIDKARKIIKKIGLDLAADPEFAPIVIEPIKMQGVQDFGDYGIELRIKMKTKPGEQFVMKRKAFVLIRAAFEQNGITIPLPSVKVIGGDGSPAASAAARTVLAQQAAAEAPA